MQFVRREPLILGCNKNIVVLQMHYSYDAHNTQFKQLENLLVF